ncbi:MAG: HlyD family type I secretion periplasmic adaptor subunit [Pseudomonadota bacterium]
MSVQNKKMTSSHEIHSVELDDKVPTRLGWLIILAGVGGFLLWASFAPLDKGVPLTGTVIVATNRKAIQHQSGGIVEDILVKEGDHVKAGQVLVKINSVQAKAQAEMSRGQFFSASAVEARLEAERDNKSSVTFSPELLASKSDARVIESMALQEQLFSSRRLAIQNELASINETIAGLKLQIQGIKESRESKKQQMQLLKEQLDNMRSLANDGYAPRNRVLELDRTYAQLSGSIAEDLGSSGRAQAQIAELMLHRLQRQQEYQKEVRQQLTDIRKEKEVLGHRLQAQDFDVAHTEVKAPVDGVIVGMNVFTREGVVGPGYRMMDIVPSDDALVIEGQLPVNLIDKVHAGLKVDLRFSAFNQNSTPHLAGTISQVSADRFVEEKSGLPYYKLKASVDKESLKSIEHLQIRAGMPVDIFVKTGERSLMSYLFKPIFDRAHTALREE